MMKKIIPILLLLAMFAGCSAPAAENPVPAEYRQIGMEEAMAIMQEESGYILLDVRTEAEFEERHIPGAICIPNETIGSEPPAELPDKDQLILIYCRSGNRSKQAAQKLADMGYTNIAEFGGINDWPGETVSGPA